MFKDFLYPSGFLVTDIHATNLPTSYDCVKINSKVNYYFDQNSFHQYHSSEGDFIILHGHFVYVGNDENIHNQNLIHVLLEKYRTNYEKFLEIIDSVGGRYAIIICHENEIVVYQDAIGARSVYYKIDEFAISSHLNLIVDNFNCTLNELVSNVKNFNIVYGLTDYLNIKALIPNFYLHENTKKLVRFFPKQKNRFNRLPNDEKVRMIEELWNKQLDFYVANFENIELSLTGGNDSRVSLAMAKNYLDKIHFFTYTPAPDEKRMNTQSTKILLRDREIVEKLLTVANLNHTFIEFDMSKVDKPRQDMKYALDKNSIMNHGRFLIKYYLKLMDSSEKHLHIRSNALEIARAYYISPRSTNTFENVLKITKKHAKDGIDEDNENYIENIFTNELESLGYDSKFYDFHKLDLYYWEHRMGRWHAEILNETDVVFETFTPFNLRKIIEIALSFNLNERKNGLLFKELINNKYPILNFFGINESENMYEKLKHYVQEKTVYFNNFTVVAEDNDTVSVESFNNKIYIPKAHFKKGAYAFVNFKYTLSSGFLQLEILNKYKSAKGNEYARYYLMKNNHKILSEDIAHWKMSNIINIFNLKKGDIITLGIEVKRSSPYDSWQNASNVEVLEYKEVPSSDIAEVEIVHTSPYSETYQ